MNQQKGNIIIVVILLMVVVGFLISQLPKFFGGEQKEEIRQEIPYSEPVFEKEDTVLSPAPKEEIKTKELDESVPQISNLQPSQDLPAETKSAYLSLETNEKATCRHSDTSGVYYEYMQYQFSTEDGLSHRFLITTFVNGQEYQYYIRCIDSQGNKNTEDAELSFMVKNPEDTTPPERTNAYPKGEALLLGTREAMIGVSTNEPASCRYDADAEKSYNSMGRSLSTDEYKKYHIATISSLEDGQYYGFYIRCKDLAGNVNDWNVLVSFSVTK